MKLTTILGAALLTQQSIAHPGQSAEENAKEVAERRAYLANNKRSLAHCADSLKARGNDLAMHARRSAVVEKLRAKRAIGQGNQKHHRIGDCVETDTKARETLPPRS